MKSGRKKPSWPIVVAVGNVVLLALLVAGIVWLRTKPNSVGMSAPPPKDSLRVAVTPPLPALPPLPRRKVIPQPPGDELFIDLDREGNIRLAGEPLELGLLRMRLCQLHADYRRRIVITIRASDDCQFRHIRDVMNVCDECVITTYRFSAPPVPSQLGRPGLNDTSAV